MKKDYKVTITGVVSLDTKDVLDMADLNNIQNSADPAYQYDSAVEILREFSSSLEVKVEDLGEAT